MIETNTASNLQGQTEMTDFMAPAEEQPEGYDANGQLINPEADVTQETASDQEIAPTGDTKIDREDRLRQLSSEINAITDHARVVLASAALEIGRRLIEARGLVPRGRFGEWLAANVDYSERKAQQLMQLYEEYGRAPLPDAYAGLGISQMTALLAAPADQRDELAKRAGDEGLSVRQLQEEIRAIRAERDALQTQMEIVEGQRDRLSESLNDTQRELEQLNDQETERDAAIERMTEAINTANAKAASAAASVAELRKLHSDAEDRASVSAQRARDAVNRANQTAKDLAEARSQIARLEAEAAARAAEEPEPEVKTVEVLPESVRQEIEDLRRQLKEALEGGDQVQTPAASPTDTPVARFRDCYNRLTSEFKTAEALIAEISKADSKTGSVYATAVVKTCQTMIDRLGVGS